MSPMVMLFADSSSACLEELRQGEASPCEIIALQHPVHVCRSLNVAAVRSKPVHCRRVAILLRGWRLWLLLFRMYPRPKHYL